MVAWEPVRAWQMRHTWWLRQIQEEGKKGGGTNRRGCPEMTAPILGKEIRAWRAALVVVVVVMWPSLWDRQRRSRELGWWLSLAIEHNSIDGGYVPLSIWQVEELCIAAAVVSAHQRWLNAPFYVTSREGAEHSNDSWALWLNTMVLVLVKGLRARQNIKRVSWCFNNLKFFSKWHVSTHVLALFFMIVYV